MTSLVTIDQDRDISISDITTENAYEINSLSVAKSNNIAANVIEASGTSYLNNSQISPTTISSSAAFRNISNVFFSSTAEGSVPVSHDENSTTDILRFIQLGRTLLDDGLVEGTITATVAFGNNIDNVYIDQPESSSTGSFGRKGRLISQALTSNIVGSVYYDYGALVFNGGSVDPNFLKESVSGFEWIVGGATADKIVLQNVSFKTKTVTKRASVFCRAFNKEFNYTNNPTSISDNVLGTITSSLTSNPTSFITTVGLYNDDNEMIAVAKTSPPIRKRFDSEVILNVQLNY